MINQIYGTLKKEIPGVREFVRIVAPQTFLVRQESTGEFWVERECIYTDPQFFSVLDFPLVEGKIGLFVFQAFDGIDVSGLPSLVAHSQKSHDKSDGARQHKYPPAQSSTLNKTFQPVAFGWCSRNGTT